MAVATIIRLQEAQTEERDQQDIDHDVYMQFVLPSYDEAQKSKPTSLPPTFDEATRAAAEEEEQQQGATAGKDFFTKLIFIRMLWLRRLRPSKNSVKE